MDFTLGLFLAVVLSGLIWLGDLLFLRRKRPAGARESVVVEYARSFFSGIAHCFFDPCISV